MSPSDAHTAALAQIDSWVAQARRQEAAALALQHRIEAIRVERWSPRGELRVVVDHSGLLRDVELTDAAMRTGAAALSRLLMATVREARALLRDAVVEASLDEHGRPTALGRSLTAEYARTFAGDGEAPADGPGRA
jgi:DNA-binding protein YbaB